MLTDPWREENISIIVKKTLCFEQLTCFVCIVVLADEMSVNLYVRH